MKRHIRIGALIISSVFLFLACERNQPDRLYVLHTYPADNDQNIPANVVISAMISSPVDPQSVNSASFTLTSDSAVTADYVCDSGNQVIRLKPKLPLKPSTRYTAALRSAIVSDDNRHLSDCRTWTFTVEGPLAVTSVSPSNGATGVAWNSSIIVTVSADVDTASGRNAFILFSGSDTIPCDLSYNAAGRQCVFMPSWPLKPGRTYTARITTGLTSLTGTHPASNYEWTFTAMSIPSSFRPFETSGNRIRYADTHVPCVLRGVNCIEPVSMQQYDNAHWNSDYFKEMADWGVKLVRIPWFPASWKWYVSKYGEGAYLGLVDQAVAWAAENGIYSMIDLHICGYPPDGDYQKDGNDPNWGWIYAFTRQDVIDFWRLMAWHFANDNRVAMFDIFNEPVYLATGGKNDPSDAWSRWRVFAEEIIDTIRNYDSTRVAMVGGLSWSYNLHYVLTDPVNRSNVIYAAHPYPGSYKGFLTPTGEWRWDSAFVVVAQIYPVIISEFGFDPNSTEFNLIGDSTSYGIMLIDSTAEPNGMSWSAFCFGPTWSPSLCTDWNYTLNEAGAFIRSRLLKYGN